MTPLQLGILMGAYAVPAFNFSDRSTETYRNQFNALCFDDMIIGNFEKYTITEKGKVWLEYILNEVPYPVQTWKVPK